MYTQQIPDDFDALSKDERIGVLKVVNLQPVRDHARYLLHLLALVQEVKNENSDLAEGVTDHLVTEVLRQIPEKAYMDEFEISKIMKDVNRAGKSISLRSLVTNS